MPTDRLKLLDSIGDGTVQLWEVTTSKEVRSFKIGHSSGYILVAFSPNGRHIFTGGGSNETTAQLWDIASGAKLQVFAGHTMVVTALAFSPDSRLVLNVIVGVEDEPGAGEVAAVKFQRLCVQVARLS